MITAWIDAMQDVWAGIQGNGFEYVRAPYLVKRPEFPETIDPLELSKRPIALSIPARVKFIYSDGGSNRAYWQGTTEFHVTPSLDLSLMPSLLKWPGLIATAAAAHFKLGGLVNHFIIQDRDDQITGPIALQYGNEAEHWGFIVYWEVHETVNSDVVIATGE
jgi:hypothetical protein